MTTNDNILSLSGDSIIVEIRPDTDSEIKFTSFRDTFNGLSLHIDAGTSNSTFSIADGDILYDGGGADSVFERTIGRGGAYIPARGISREFRIITNNIFRTDWKPLNDDNLKVTSIPTDSIIQVRYTRIGDDEEGDIEFVKIDLEGTYTARVLNSTPTLDASMFSSIAKDADTDALAINLFKKLYYRGIVPQYIKRAENFDLSEDKDYVALFYTISTFFAIIFRFFKRFENFYNDLELMREWIRQKGIYFDESIITLEELQYFAQNLYSEYCRRGTNMIFFYKGDTAPNGETLPIDGEFIRLIRGGKDKELLYENIPLQNVGWCLGCSSPMYRGLNNYDVRLNKIGINPFHTDDLFIDAMKADSTFNEAADRLFDGDACNSVASRTIDGGYADSTYNNPLSKFSNFASNGNISIRNFDDKDVLRITSVSSAGNVGIGRLNENVNVSSDLYVADPLMDYEICFAVNVRSGSGTLNFEVEGFDALKNSLNDAFIMPNGDQVTNTFLSLSLNKLLPGHWYYIRGIVHAYSSEPKSETKLNIGYGTNLYFNNSFLRYIFPKIYLKGVGDIYIYDYKIRPLVRGTNILPLKGKTYENCFSLGFIQSNRIFHAYFRNSNNNQSQSEITDIIEKYLLPYDMTDILTFINAQD